MREALTASKAERNTPSQATEQSSLAQRGGANSWHPAFDAVDANHDGVIDRAEWEQAQLELAGVPSTWLGFGRADALRQLQNAHHEVPPP